MGQWDLCWCTVRGLSKIEKTHMLHTYYQYHVQRSERVGTCLLATGILSILRPAKEDNIFNSTSGAHRRITMNRRARSQFVHTMSTLLRNRSPRKRSTKTLRHRHDDNDYSRSDKRKDTRRHYPYILKASATSFLLISLYKMLLPNNEKVSWSTVDHTNSDVINLDPIDIVSTVPLGFTLNLPKNSGALERYLDHNLIASIYSQSYKRWTQL